jgi:glycosyltransferase involved in cell wall biosynthesis
LPPDETHDTAIMVNPAPDSIAEGLMRLTRMEQSERKALGQRGRALVIGRYTWENIAREMIAVYHWMINAGPRPDCLVDA